MPGPVYYDINRVSNCNKSRSDNYNSNNISTTAIIILKIILQMIIKIIIIIMIIKIIIIMIIIIIKIIEIITIKIIIMIKIKKIK